MIFSLIRVNIVDKIFKRIFIDKILIYNNAKILEDTLNSIVISFDRIKSISRDY